MKATDPVCKMTVDTETAGFKSEYNGESYFFCAEGCKTKFDNSPLIYLNAPEEASTESPHEEKKGGVEISFSVTGMHCASCVGKVEKTLTSLDGVNNVSVNLATEKAAIKYDPDIIDANKIIDKIKSSGYDVPLQTTKLAISGMSCASCVAAIEKSLNTTDGVTDASVNLATEQAVISHVAGVGVMELKSAIEKAGYEVIDIDPGEAGDVEREIREREYRMLKSKFVVSAILTVVVLALAMLKPFGATINHYAQLFVTIPVIFWSGSRFYKGFWKSLIHKSADMNTLVAVGTASAFIYSIAATVDPGLFSAAGRDAHVYFDTAAVIITLILFGRLLEAGAKGKTSEAIKKLMGLRAKTARVERDGNEIDIDINDVKPGDIVAVIEY